VYQQQEQQEEQDAENPFLDPPFSRIKRRKTENFPAHSCKSLNFADQLASCKMYEVTKESSSIRC
jgi:hypothetical protein